MYWWNVYLQSSQNHEDLKNGTLQTISQDFVSIVSRPERQERRENLNASKTLFQRSARSAAEDEGRLASSKRDRHEWLLRSWCQLQLQSCERWPGQGLELQSCEQWLGQGGVPAVPLPRLLRKVCVQDARQQEEAKTGGEKGDTCWHGSATHCGSILNLEAFPSQWSCTSDFFWLYCTKLRWNPKNSATLLIRGVVDGVARGAFAPPIFWKNSCNSDVIALMTS